MARQLVAFALIFIAIVGLVSAQDGAKSAPLTEGGGSASAAQPTTAAASGPAVDEAADPAGVSPAGSGADAADGPIGETTTTDPSDPGVVPMGPTSSVAAGPSGNKSGTGGLKVSVVAGAAGAVTGFLFLFLSV